MKQFITGLGKYPEMVDTNSITIYKVCWAEHTSRHDCITFQAKDEDALVLALMGFIMVNQDDLHTFSSVEGYRQFSRFNSDTTFLLFENRFTNSLSDGKEHKVLFGPYEEEMILEEICSYSDELTVVN
jgi:hypothetical protein